MDRISLRMDEQAVAQRTTTAAVVAAVAQLKPAEQVGLISEAPAVKELLTLSAPTLQLFTDLVVGDKVLLLMALEEPTGGEARETPVSEELGLMGSMKQDQVVAEAGQMAQVVNRLDVVEQELLLFDIQQFQNWRLLVQSRLLQHHSEENQSMFLGLKFLTQWHMK
jgi:hypothetical protein